jgi:hypothetical protein
VGKGMRDPRKEYQANASPKRLNQNLVSGTWTFEDTTSAVDIVIPWPMNTKEPIVVASLASIGIGPVGVAGWSYIHPKYKNITISLYLIGANGKRWLKKLKKPCKIGYFVDGR